MSVLNALVPPRAYDELTTDGVHLVLRSLFAIDCQTCEKPLGDQPPSIAFLRVDSHIEASVHHKECAAPAWLTDSDEYVERATTLHYFVTKLLWQSSGPWCGRVIPMVVVNPSLEAVAVVVDDGQVRVLSADVYGFRRYAEMTDIGIPTPGVHLVVDVHIPAPGFNRVWVLAAGCPLWPLELEETTVREAHAAGGILLLVTHQLDPSTLADLDITTGTDLDRLLAHADTYAAWAPLMVGIA